MTFTGRDQAFNDKTVSNPDGFFAPVTLGLFNSIARVGTGVAQELVEDAILIAMLQINQELVVERAAWADQAFASVADVHPQGAHLYQTAVIYRAKEQLTRDYPTLTRHQPGDAAAREASEVIGHCNLETERRLALLCGRRAEPARVSLI